MFIGRQDELRFLEDKYQQNDGQFIVVQHLLMGRGLRGIFGQDLRDHFGIDSEILGHLVDTIFNETQMGHLHKKG